jgi:hypothetical protein
MVAALFVQTGGSYHGLPEVEMWDEERDARTYPGPHPVVAHPPCARWGRYWHGGPSVKVRRERGADEGCFGSALKSVQSWGGVLEHPEASSAWLAFNIARPHRSGGWIPAGLFHPGWTCCVEQGHYGHRARKATWLYAVGVQPAQLRWGSCGERARLDAGFHSAEDRKRALSTHVPNRLTSEERLATPPEFRDALLSIARSSSVRGSA